MYPWYKELHDNFYFILISISIFMCIYIIDDIHLLFKITCVSFSSPRSVFIVNCDIIILSYIDKNHSETTIICVLHLKFNQNEQHNEIGVDEASIISRLNSSWHLFKPWTSIN